MLDWYMCEWWELKWAALMRRLCQYLVFLEDKTQRGSPERGRFPSISAFKFHSPLITHVFPVPCSRSLSLGTEWSLGDLNSCTSRGTMLSSSSFPNSKVFQQQVCCAVSKRTRNLKLLLPVLVPMLRLWYSVPCTHYSSLTPQQQLGWFFSFRSKARGASPPLPSM